MAYKTMIDKAMPFAKVVGGFGVGVMLFEMLEGGAFKGFGKYGAYMTAGAAVALVIRGASQILYGGSN